MTDYFIYTLCDPRDGLAYYVGCSRNPLRRLRQHLSWSLLRTESRSAKGKWLRNLKRANLMPALKVLCRCDETDRDSIEQQWIKELLKQGNPLVNTKTCLANVQERRTYNRPNWTKILDTTQTTQPKD